MTSENQTPSIGPLPPDLQARLDAIIRTVPRFWEKKIYPHFTNHGPSQSERVHRLLAQIAQELPERLISFEIFIVSAAAWLYEIGIQSPTLKPILDFEFRGQSLTTEQLMEIRQKKHFLTEKLIIDNVREDYQGQRLPLGLTSPTDILTLLIAKVCRWCSDEPLRDVPDIDIFEGFRLRIRLLVALLRLADQLYIDNSRIDLVELERAKLPERQFIRWWIYHYIETMPIANGLIRFNYFLPSQQKEYIGHVRALIERDFEYERNQTIQYLSETHRLRLMLSREPSVSGFDQTPGFQRPMGSNLTAYLNLEIEPIVTSLEEVGTRERCLLLMDYENFLLQLGQEGFFFSTEDFKRLLPKLLYQVNRDHGGTVDGFILGHWERPDLVDVAQMLEKSVFRKITLRKDELPYQKFVELLENETRGPNAVRRIILVAPPSDLQVEVKRLVDNRLAITAWTSDVPDAAIYTGGIGNYHKPLYRVLDILDDPRPTNPIDLEFGLTSCILTLDPESNSDQRDGKDPLEIPMIRSYLDSIPIIDGHYDWWILMLVQSQILIQDQVSSFAGFHLDTNHPLVVKTRQMRDTVIKTIRSISKESDKIREDILIKELRSIQSSLFRAEDQTRQLLDILKGEEVLRRSANLDDPHGSPLWELNPAYGPAIRLDAATYLPPFVLAIDHLLINNCFPGLHEHTLERNLATFLPESLIHPIYITARTDGWVQRKETNEHLQRGEGNVALVIPDEYHSGTGDAFRNRNLILSFLKSRINIDGINRNKLWEKLSKAHEGVFTLQITQFHALIDLMLMNKILLETIDNDNGSHIVKLNLEERLTQRLFGRMYLHGLVRSLRKLRATSPDKKRAEKDLDDILLRTVTNNNREILKWVKEFASTIKLLLSEESIINGEKVRFVWLNRHSFIRKMDERERIICEEMPKWLIKLSRDRNGWVPKPVIYAEMNKITTYGSSRSEHEVWLETAIWRGAVQQEKRQSREKGDEYFLRATKQP